MKERTGKRLKFALWVVVAATLVVMSAGTLFAAGEQLERSAVLSGGNTRSSNGFVMRDVIGLWAAGSSISSATGVGLCSGFGCDSRVDSVPDVPGEPEGKVFIPAVEKAP